ncbi:MAG TPA: iron ABC transporter permease [Gemmatimonadales bacterium]|nr:iron ABC transporter permease [Gemmatimonadales bacterium]
MRRPSTPSLFVVLAVFAALAAVAGVGLGAAGLSPREIALALAGRGDDVARGIVWSLRLPRVALGFVVGGVLAVSGAALQALVRNPLADPYLLGLSGGAGLGAVLALVAGVVSAWVLPAAAFAGALAATLLVYRLALVAGRALDSRMLLLGGVVVGAFAGALVAGILSVSDAAQLRTATLWLMGGLGGVGWPGVLVLVVYAVPALAVLVAESRALNLLALGEEPAVHLGADVARTKRRVYVAASLLTAASVAAAGIIGFVGLVVPHTIRLLKGHDHRVLLPAAFVLGGAFLVLADALARTAFAPLELPVGVVTAVVGVPFFVVLLKRWTSR